MMNKKISLLLLTVWAMGSAIQAQESLNPEDLENLKKAWRCKYCPEQEPGFSAEAYLGPLYISNDSFKYGEYTGLNREGFYIDGGMALKYQAENAPSWQLTGKNLGLSSRELQASLSQPARYHLEINYQQLPQASLDTARTPYTGNNTLILPTTWASGTTTADFNTLDTTLMRRSFETERKNVSLTGKYLINTHWQGQFSIGQESKQGLKPVGALLGNSFAIARVALLPEPVDYRSQHLQLSIDFRSPKIYSQASYHYAQFDNKNSSLTWQNAYTEPTGITQGQLALAPDNQLHRLSWSGNYFISPTSQAGGRIVGGEIRQNTRFLPYTVNSSLTTFSLPQESLKGEVTTLQGDIFWWTRLFKKLRLDTRYHHEEQNNQNKRATFDYVVGDTSLSATARANSPYSFRKRDIKLKADYTLPWQSQFSLGWNQRWHDRTYQEITTSRENQGWLKLRTAPLDYLEFAVKLEQHLRDTGKYNHLTEVIPGENPLLRKYNLADRKRQVYGSSLQLHPGEQWSAELAWDQSKDDFYRSPIGLTLARTQSWTLSLNYSTTNHLNLNVFVNQQRIESDQANSQTFSTPDWFAHHEDKILTTGLGLTYPLIKNKLEIEGQFSHSQSQSDIRLSGPSPSPFPTLKTLRNSFYLAGNYHITPRWAVILKTQYEKYDEANWSVNPDTLANVLSLGEISPQYHIGLVSVTTRYIF